MIGIASVVIIIKNYGVSVELCTINQLSVISYQLSVISYQLWVYCSLFTVYCSLFTLPHR
ncbi:MAG: hypothetical protein EWV61_03650 [Microcystis aeruginosa Ma_AC_P_19900807_S300]|nr:MAG: hypothetical protein EWV61_03650 [Microcystis aeruginosa Ma_AC_P_19900807_S300]